MSSSSKHVADLLNEASNCGLGGVANLADFLTEYFGDPQDSASVADESMEEDDDSSDDSDEDNLDSDDDNLLAVHDNPLTGNDEADELDREDADEVADAMAGIADAEEIHIKERKCHCNCKIFNGSRCIEQFTQLECDEIGMNIAEMSCFEKDLLILGMISASVNTSEMTESSKQKPAKRKCTRIRWFYFNSKRICRDTFLYLMAISKEKFTNLKNWYNKNGLIPRRKKSGGKKDKRTFSLDVVERVVKFILHYAEIHSLVLPGRIPGLKNYHKVKLLPSHMSKAKLYRLYKEGSGEQTIVGLSTFKKLWRDILPYVIICKPATDLCWACQKNNNMIVRQVNVSEEEKSAALKNQEEHLRRATMERTLYKERCDAAKNVVKEHNLEGLGKSAPNSRDLEFHYSFDYAQQVHYPCNPLQPGPIFFKTCRKCQIFGIVAEGFPSQVNYLTDEIISKKKGPNSVISLLHHFLENYGVGEKHMVINCDNCCGQNKNNLMMDYLLWRINNGLHTSITVSFLLAGHTKFAPDGCFGLFKREFRRTDVSCLDDIVKAVNNSTQEGINKACLVGNESGEQFVNYYDWDSYLKPHFRRLTGIKSFHHFFFHSDHPDSVHVKEFHDSAYFELKLLKGRCPDGFPNALPIQDLDDDRRAYLFNEVREFCRPETRDLVCPAPL